MIKGWIGKTNFYQTVKKKEAERRADTDFAGESSFGALVQKQWEERKKEMEAEQALTARQIETGMMFRKTMGENEGMIFVFQRPNSRGFWMKNCPVPMSAAYIDPQGRINEIVKLDPHNTNSVKSRSFQIQYVLEAPRGWFKKNGLGPGVTIMTPKGTLPQTYFPGRQ